MREYSWKARGFEADAQVVGEELERLEMAGELNSEEVLRYAEKHPESELYKCFEWDDDEASRKYRLIQASQILCSISLKITEEPVKKQRVYVSIKSSTSNERKFKNIKDVLENDEEYKQLLEKAQNEFYSCKEKYEELVQKEDLKEIIFDLYKKI